MQSISKQPYDNCPLLGPDGLVLCYISNRRAKWYLERDLAVIENDDPFSVRLKFEPRGAGTRDDPYSHQIRLNQCVVCGVEDGLTKHHVVPRAFRRHFPNDIKDHDNHDVLMLCCDCHLGYEIEASRFHRELCERYGVPYKRGDCLRSPRAYCSNLAKSLLRHGDKIPAVRQEEMRAKIIEIFGYLPDLAKLAGERWMQLRYDRANSYGRRVVELSGVEEISKLWRRHFIETMQPRHLPPYWDVDRG